MLMSSAPQAKKTMMAFTRREIARLADTKTRMGKAIAITAKIIIMFMSLKFAEPIALTEDGEIVHRGM